MDLCLASHRAVFKALQAFEDGELALTAAGLLTIVTTEGEIRLLDGVCFAAPHAGWIGAELIGWLEELHGLSGVGAWWRPGLRAVLRKKDGRLAVASSSQDLVAGSTPATSGFATHSARFIVANGDVGEPASPAAPLRQRGTWRSTAVVPWTLGQGRPVTRAPREPLGPLPPPRAGLLTMGPQAAPNPGAPRAPVYTPVPRSVRTLPKVLPPPRREASSSDRLSYVA